jgi:hypothetical protein
MVISETRRSDRLGVYLDVMSWPFLYAARYPPPGVRIPAMATSYLDDITVRQSCIIVANNRQNDVTLILVSDCLFALTGQAAAIQVASEDHSNSGLKQFWQSKYRPE